MKHALITILTLIAFAGFSATIYIDPSKHTTGENGTIGKPYDSWTDCTLSNGNTYLQKRGTVYVSSIQIRVTDNSVTIGAYGAGNRPVFSYIGTNYAFSVSASYCYISDFEVNGNGTAYALYGSIGSTGEYWQHNKINNCLLENAHNPNSGGFGIHAFYNAGLKVLNTEIRNVAIDGMYLRFCPKTEVGYCNVHDVNRRYFVNTNQTSSSGDGIQFDGNYNGFWLHHTIVDRTNGAGNKFIVIFNSAPGISDKATGLIEYCEFENDATVTCAVHIERGNGIIVRHNLFAGSTLGIRVAGKYSNNTQIYDNNFYNCDRGVGIGATYPGGFPAIGTKVFDNHFTNTRRYQIWVDKSAVEVCGNTTDGVGTPQYNYGGGSFNTVTCK